MPHRLFATSLLWLLATHFSCRDCALLLLYQDYSGCSDNKKTKKNVLFCLLLVQRSSLQPTTVWLKIPWKTTLVSFWQGWSLSGKFAALAKWIHPWWQMTTVWMVNSTRNPQWWSFTERSLEEQRLSLLGRRRRNFGEFKMFGQPTKMSQILVFVAGE